MWLSLFPYTEYYKHVTAILYNTMNLKDDYHATAVFTTLQ